MFYLRACQNKYLLVKHQIDQVIMVENFCLYLFVKSFWRCIQWSVKKFHCNQILRDHVMTIFFSTMLFFFRGLSIKYEYCRNALMNHLNSNCCFQMNEWCIGYKYGILIILWMKAWDVIQCSYDCKHKIPK